MHRMHMAPYSNMPNFRVFLWIATLALGLRLGAATYWHAQAAEEGVLFRLGDSDGYWHLASQLARGLPYQYGSPDASIFRAPLLPILLSPCTLIEPEQHGVFVARVVGCGLGTAAVVLVMLLTARLSTRSGSVLAAGLIASVYPTAIGMSVTILSEMLMVPLLLLYLLAWQQAWRSDSSRLCWHWSFAAGLLAGLLVLARPSCLLLIPFITGVGLLVGGRIRRPLAESAPQPSSLLDRPRVRHLAIGIVSCLGLSVCMLPWWIRNAGITGRFVPTTLQVGASLLDGLHPGATGASDEGMAFMREVEREQRWLDASSPTPPLSTFEYRINQLALQKGLDFATSHPGDTLHLAWAKLARTWSIWPDGGELGSAPLRLAITISTVTVALLAIWGSLLLWPEGRWELAICWIPCLYFSLLHMVFVGSIRYREPAVFVLIAVAGIGFAELLAKRKLTASKDDAAAVETPG